MGGHGPRLPQIYRPKWPHWQIEKVLTGPATWLIAADYAAGNIWPISPVLPGNLFLPIAQNLPDVIALAGDGNGTVYMVSQSGESPFCFSLKYPGAVLGPLGNPTGVFCRNGIAFIDGGILGMSPTGSIQAYDTGFNPLGGSYPALPALPSPQQGLAVDTVRGILYAACQNALCYLDLSAPTTWNSPDLASAWSLGAQPFPLTLAVESQSGDVYVLYLPDAGQPSQANVGVFNFSSSGNNVAALSPINFSPGGGLAVGQVDGNVSVFASVMVGGICSIEGYSTAQKTLFSLPAGPSLQQVQALAVTETAVTWLQVILAE
jgi:hypothetical protein